jgi:hypothetical protein
MPDHRLTPKIGSRRKNIHAEQTRAKNAVLLLLAPLVRHRVGRRFSAFVRQSGIYAWDNLILK